jgi:CelD/BcsL family acetyltransferase involved in cellulose biosynthesis
MDDAAGAHFLSQARDLPVLPSAGFLLEMPVSSRTLVFVAQPVAQLAPEERAAWSMLVDRDGINRYAFMSPAYAEAVAAVDASAVVLVGYDAGKPVCFLPLQRRPDWAGRFGAYEPIGGVMTDYFGLVASPDMHIDIGAALRRAGLPVVAFTHLEAEQQQYGLVGVQPRVGLQTHIEAPVEEFWSRLRKTDKKFVSDTERRERKLTADHGAVSFELASSSSQADLQALIELKRAQYQRTDKQQAPLFERRNVDLLFRLLEEKSPQCTGMLSTLKIGDRMVAAHFGLRCHEVLHYWFPVYDPAYANYAPGRILFRHVLEAVAQQGVTLIDRGEGDTQAKRDFANREHQFYRGLWSAGGLGAMPARAALALIWRLA